MKPYYEHGGITIYHGDCREILPSLPHYDLLITDPPYCIGYESTRRDVMPKFGEIAGDNDHAGIFERLKLAISRLENGRHVYVFGPFDLSPLPLGGLTPLIWDKGIMGVGNTALPWCVTHEQITFGVRVWSPKNRAAGYGNGAARLRKGSVLRFIRAHSGETVNHPTEKPIMLLRELIESSSHLGETVCDPICRERKHSDSCSIRRASRHRDRDRGTLLRNRRQEIGEAASAPIRERGAGLSC